jgi:zinc transporter ZupT
VVLEHFSMGIEHGHMHMPPPGGLPALTLFSLSLHSFAEGIPFADPGVAGDMHFLAGVLMHKIPMAIALITVMQRAGLGQGRTWVAMVLFASAAPLGILFGDAIGRLLEPTLLLHMLGLAIGMLMHIGTTIIFESAPGHRFHAQRFAAVLLGAVLSIFSMHG